MRRFKSLLAFVLATILCFGTFVTAFADNSVVLYLGDANIDGNVNVKDATYIQKFVADMISFDENSKLCADADENGNINVKDATLIQKYIVGMDIATPVGEVIVPEEPTLPEETITTPTETTVPVTTTAPANPVETTPSVTEPTTQATDPVETQATTAATEATAAPTEPKEKMDTNITIYFSNNQKWVTVNAYLYNESAQKELASWPGVPMKLHSTNGYGEQIYMLDVDVSEYNRVVFNNGTSQSMNASLSVASSGFYIANNTPKNSMALGVYAFEENNYGNQTTVQMDYPDGYKKPITIWTPNGYDPADTSKKYQVIYLLDGQNQFLGTTNGYGGWVTDKIATCLQNNGHDGFILVGIDNSRNRDKELTPDIGNVVPAYKNDFENGVGETFAKFVAETVKPYIEANYNASTLAEDNAIIGSSSGGIEAFYIGMEYMEEFGKIGAISPAFLLFDKSEWDKYLDKFDFSNASALPRIYFFNGGADALEVALKTYAELMPQWLIARGYDADKVTFCYENTFAHNEYAWRMIMPEILAWLFELQ